MLKLTIPDVIPGIVEVPACLEASLVRPKLQI
jgi:hypothetical protein